MEYKKEGLGMIRKEGIHSMEKSVAVSGLGDRDFKQFFIQLERLRIDHDRLHRKWWVTMVTQSLNSFSR